MSLWCSMGKGLIHGLLLAAALAASVIISAHAEDACANSAERLVRVGQTVTMCIPQPWIDSVAGSETEGDILLFALWPSLGGFYDGNEQTRPVPGLDYGGRVQVLLHLSDRVNSLQNRYENMLRLYSPYSRYEPTMGLEHWGRDALPTWNSNTKREIYFTLKNSEQVVRYIICDLPGTQMAPGCSEEMYIGPFLARITYSRVFLSEWHGIESGIEQKVTSFLR